MPVVTLPVTFALAAAATIIYLLYRALLPKPIPGIPYNEASVHRLLGDIPDLIQWQNDFQEPFSLLAKRCRDLKSPIVQVFTRVGGKPWVVVADGREATDIMTRRLNEFDRSKYFGDLWNAILPQFQAQMRTDEKWKVHRRLLADTMAPSFLNLINGPTMYTAFNDLLELWRAKMEIVGDDNRPLDVEHDITHAALDAIWAAAFGQPAGVIQRQLRLVEQLSQSDVKSINGVAHFPEAEIPIEINAVNILGNSTEITAKSPFGGLHHKFATIFYPSLRAAMRAKQRLLRKKVEDAERRFKAKGEESVESAIDYAIAREIKAAQKENRTPDLHSGMIYDELYGYLIAGHDTAATTCAWGLNFLMRHPEKQTKLRAALETAYPKLARGEIPTAHDITTVTVPYVEAFMEEVMRLGPVASAHMRVTTRNTEIFGYNIPKGIDVFMLTVGPSMHSPALSVDDASRSNTSLKSREKLGDFNDEDITAFKPERWLKLREGKEVFDPNAGPSLGFGTGPRACFGKKLGLLELRIFFILVVCNFEVICSQDISVPVLRRQELTLKPRDVHVVLRDLKHRAAA